MKEKEIKEIIAKGYVLCRVIFEMAGNPKEHVEQTLRKYLNTIKEDPEYIFTSEHYAEAEEHEGVWSTFMEAEVLVANFEKLNVLCFNMTPASVEILEPESVTFTQKKMTDWFNDILSKLHEISMITKGLSSENDLLKVNLNRAIRNLVVLSLNEPRTKEEIATKVGIDDEHIQPFIDVLIKEKTIILEDNKYRRTMP